MNRDFDKFCDRLHKLANNDIHHTCQGTSYASLSENEWVREHEIFSLSFIEFALTPCITRQCLQKYKTYDNGSLNIHYVKSL